MSAASAGSLSPAGPHAGPAEGALAVAVHGVSRRFGPTLALADVSLALPAGETRGLIGRNGAGKSTLVGLMTGLLEPTEGRIEVWGEPAPRISDRATWRRLVGTVHQHSTLQRDLSVAENLFLGGLPTRSAGLISWREIRARARTILDEWELDLPATRLARDLTLGQRQLVEIARELSRGARFVILDEPTSRLASAEIEQLYGHVRRLKADGVTIVFISHHLNEVMELCDAVTVLKDGRHVVTRQVRETTAEQLVADMVGDAADVAVGTRLAPGAARAADVAMTVDGLHAPGLEPLGFELRAGETLGIAGLVGSGKELLAELLAGEAAADGGELRLGDRTLASHTVAEAIEAGIAVVPGDRHRSGQVAGLGIGENVTMTIAGRIAGRLGFVAPRRRRAVAAELMRDVGVVAASPRQPAASLSGGNQQKGVVARALASRPRVLVLVNPTTGVDIASKATIFDVIVRHRDEGMAVVLISDELEEYELCDRVLVLFGGRVVREMDRGFALEDLLAAIEGVGVER